MGFVASSIDFLCTVSYPNSYVFISSLISSSRPNIITVIGSVGSFSSVQNVRWLVTLFASLAITVQDMPLGLMYLSSLYDALLMEIKFLIVESIYHEVKTPRYAGYQTQCPIHVIYFSLCVS